MRGKTKWGFWVGLGCCGVASCGQELVLPSNKPLPASDAPSEGLTGASGAHDDVGPRARLPTADEPSFTTFGGAGGDATGRTDGALNDDVHGGAPDQSSTVPPTGGASSLHSSAGGGGMTLGGKGAGGNSGSGGKAASGGGGVTAGGGTLTVGDAGAAGATTAPAALMFSEYVEGSGSFKALEIYAFEASSLEGCELLTYFNGKLEPSRLALHGQLGRGELQVLCSSTLATAQPQACSRSTSLTFNGDDALGLSCGGELLDVIGQIGVDPGDAWGAGATADHTLRRRCEVLAGRRDGTSPFEIDAEWLTLGIDTFSDLGVRNCAP